MGFKMIYWTTISGSYYLKGCILEKCGNFRKNGRFSGRIWPDWGNTARADMAGLGSIGLNIHSKLLLRNGAALMQDMIGQSIPGALALRTLSREYTMRLGSS